MEKLFNSLNLESVKEFAFYWFGYRYGELDKLEEVLKLDKAGIIAELIEDITWSEFTLKNVKAMMLDLHEEEFLIAYDKFLGGKL